MLSDRQDKPRRAREQWDGKPLLAALYLQSRGNRMANFRFPVWW